MHMHRHMAAKDGGTEQGCAGCSEGLKAWAGGVGVEVKVSRLSEP